jgi:hypothetical protein
MRVSAPLAFVLLTAATSTPVNAASDLTGCVVVDKNASVFYDLRPLVRASGFASSQHGRV